MISVTYMFLIPLNLHTFKLELVENCLLDHENCTPRWMPDPLHDLKGWKLFTMR